MRGEKLLKSYVIENKVIIPIKFMCKKNAYEKWPKAPASH
jgi:hypothetical protein